MTHRCLLVSFGFPPTSGPNPFLVSRLMGNIPGWKADVISVRTRIQNDEDQEWEPYVRPRFGARTVVSQPRWERWLPYRYLPFLGRYPDNFVYTLPRAIRQAEALDLARYEALVTWSQPPSSHLVGLRLKRRAPALRWVAYFSDPWADNPYVRHGPLSKRLNARLEARVVTTADAIVFTNRETLERVTSRYPDAIAEKARVVPHTIDPGLYPPAASRSEGPIVLRYVGYFYGVRTPVPLLRALVALWRARPDVLDGVRVELIGGMDPRFRGEPEWGQLPAGLVKVLDRVPFRASLRLMCEARGLLLIDAPMERSMFLPSKLIDYLGAERPILGLTPPGCAADLLQDLGGYVAAPDDPEGGAGVLVRFIDDIRSGRATSQQALRRAAQGYHVSSVALAMQAILEGRSVHEARPPTEEVWLDAQAARGAGPGYPCRGVA